ncbi:MAG: hypothetical protein E1N59_3248 [Puniceicoccaceae bacterium 5H]|nr:MAG: hypothetical protein E1N59_3248 [Puniceicoccaceae bacterium 5H]
MSTTANYRDRLTARKQRLRAPAATAAALALGAIASSAQAAITYDLTPGITGMAISINPLTGAIATGSGTTSETYPIAAAICNYNILGYNTGAAGSSLYGSFLSEGDVVDSSLSYESNYLYFGTVAESEPFYVGFSFTNQGAGSDEAYYGYLEMQSIGVYEIELIGYAFGGDNEAVTVGPVAAGVVPEPSTYAAILGGVALLGAVGYRRRQRSALKHEA